MAMGRRLAQRQADLFIATGDLPQSPGHCFYEKLNHLLDEAHFDRYVEDLCQPYYAEGLGRDSIPPGVYFRMLLVGSFSIPNGALPGAAPTACPCVRFSASP